MEDYIVNYTLISKDHRDMSKANKEQLYLKLSEGEELEKKVSETFKGIVNDSNKNNLSVQILGVYPILKEVKLENYFFNKEGIKVAELE